MARTKIHVGLEIGTTKTCMVVGEVRPDATVTIIGMGELPSAGIRKGEIIDQSMARQSVFDAWSLAQDHSGADILSVYVSVTGAHIVGQNNKGTYRLPLDESIIEQGHMDEVRSIASEFPLGVDHFTLHRESGLYSIDGQEPITNPEGLSGRTLDTNCHIIHGIKTRIVNTLRCVREVPLEVDDVIFAPLATAQIVLSRQAKEQGALLIDIGGGTTDYICYKDGQLIASGCVPVGGEHITNDIHMVAKINHSHADILKKTEGNAFGDLKDSSIARSVDSLGRDATIQRGVLNGIIQSRLKETLLIVKSRIPEELWRSHAGMNIYLVGGTSMMRGLGELAKHIFGVPINQPPPVASSETPRYLEDPRYCTVLGLIRYAQRFDEEASLKGGLFRRIFSMFSRN